MQKKQIRIFQKMVTGCSVCPSLIYEKDSVFCEKTAEIYTGREVFMNSCPLSEAGRTLMDTGLNIEERMMISGNLTMKGLHNEF